MQELIGYYIPMEEYYMRESVNKVCAISEGAVKKASSHVQRLVYADT